MKNRLFISIGLFLFAIAVGVYSFFYVVKTTDKVSDTIVSLQKHVVSGDYSKVSDESKNLDDMWRKSHHILEIFIHHEALENVDQSLSIISTSIDKECWDDFWSESARAKSQIENLHDSENPSIGNIL